MNSPESVPTRVDRELDALIAGAAMIEKLSTPAAFRLSASAQGPRAVIFGSIHGDEPAGYEAIKELLKQFADGRLRLRRGSLTIAVGNELALERRVRKVEQNLNRLFKPEPNTAPTCYEERRAEALKALLADADYMMDLHATSQPTPTFVMCESHLLDEAREMGFARIVTGWGELGDKSLGGDTEGYINARGGKGFTVETGQRDSAESPLVAMDAARRFLRHLGMVPHETPAGSAAAAFKLFASVNVDETTFRYARPFCSFDELEDGALIGHAGAEPHRAPRDCVLVMPSAGQFMLAEPVE
jgi:predicted deacylase